MAAVPTTTKLLTADDLLAMPDDGYRYELVRGELVRLPMSGHQSSRIAIRIATESWPFVEAGSLGNIAGADGAYIFERDPYTVRIPTFHLSARSDCRQRKRWRSSSNSLPIWPSKSSPLRQRQRGAGKGE